MDNAWPAFSAAKIVHDRGRTASVPASRPLPEVQGRMQKLVECVPNISEGRDRGVIDAVTAVVGEVEGVAPAGRRSRRRHQPHRHHLHRQPPRRVAEAAFRVVRRAAELIDMSRHQGAHPRHGATDVCPFVPVRGVTMDECAELARAGRPRASATSWASRSTSTSTPPRAPERRNLADVRKGEYEALPRKLGTAEWAPDFGPNAWNERDGAHAARPTSAARGFLVAYNVNLNTRDKELASQIALDIKEAGRAQARRRRARSSRTPPATPCSSRALPPARLQGRGLVHPGLRARPGLDQPRQHRRDQAPPGLRGLRAPRRATAGRASPAASWSG